VGLSPWFKGDRKQPWTFSLETDSGTFDITGLTTSDFKLKMLNITTSERRDGTGTFSNLTAASGSAPASITFNQSADDVGTLDKFAIHVVCKENTAQQETFDMGDVTFEE
jgi:hypothetical protein